MRRLIASSFGLLLSASAATVATAGELDPQAVPADVTWLIHVDVERMVDSTVGQLIIEHAEDLDIDLHDLEQMEEEIGIDPLEDIYNVTLHGRGDPDEDLTVVLTMSEKIDAIVEHASREEAYRRLDVDGHTVHRWDDGDPTYVYITDADRDERRTVVISGRKSRVRDTIHVMEDEQPSLEDALEEDDDSASVKGLPRSGSLVFAYAKGMPWLEDDDDNPASAIVRRSNRLQMELRERNETTSLDIAISARSRRDAGNIRDVLRGVVALGELLSGTEPDLDELGEILRAIDIDTRGNDIRIEIELDSRKFVEQMSAVSQLM